jgi:hypothetical protein
LEVSVSSQFGSGLAASYFVVRDARRLADVDFDAPSVFRETVSEISRWEKGGSFWRGGPVDNFAALYEGKFSAPKAGLYTFRLTSDDGAALFIDGARVINHDGLHSATGRSAKITLDAGVHAIELRYFEARGDAVLDLDWSGPGFARRQMTFDQPVEQSRNPAPTGLSASYFVVGGPRKLADVDFDAKPAFRETVTEINRSEKDGAFWRGGPSDNFAALYEGDFFAPKAGRYAFRLTSDDGAALYVDGARVINHDGVHSATARSATVTLDAGTHAIELRYFEALGGAVVDLDWSGPGFARRQMIFDEPLAQREPDAPTPNAAPVAKDDGGYGAMVGGEIAVPISAILANDVDPDGDTIVFAGLGSVTGGTATVDGDSIVFSAQRAGSASLTYAIADPAGASDTATITIDVKAPPSSADADFVVATNGRDGAVGSVDSPLATIGQAIYLAKPGDVILVRGGVYEGPLAIWKGGRDGAPVTIKAFPGERPIIDGDGTRADTDLVSITASHVEFSGFEVRGATRSGISVWSAKDVALIDNVVHDAVRGGIYVGSDKLGVSSGHLLDGNVVYNTVLENSARNWSEGWARAVAMDNSTDTVVRNNTIFKNYGEGVGSVSSTDILYKNNIVYDNFSVQVYLDNVQDFTATDNIIFHSGDTDFFRYKEPGIGLLIANEYTTYEMPSERITVQDNIFADVEPVFYDGSYGRGGGISDSSLGPNTILPFSAIDPEWLY